MPVSIPTTLDEVLDELETAPDAVLLAGGTDLMVEVNEGHRRLPVGEAGTTVVALDRVAELTTWTVDPPRRRLTLGAGVTWRALESEPLCAIAPALAEASRTVGSPQIRNAGTIGGNLATCSPAGDGLPVLAALDATVQIASRGGRRELPLAAFMLGVKRTALEPGEVIVSVTIPLLDGWQGFSKVGVRNAMVIATASACLATDVAERSVRIALGSVAPTVIRCPDAEAAAAAAVDWEAGAVAERDARRVGALAADASRPIDDHRSTADYRRHAVAVMVARLLQRAFPGPPAEARGPA